MIHREMLSLVNFSLLTVLMQRFPNLLKTATYNFKINFLDVLLCAKILILKYKYGNLKSVIIFLKMFHCFVRNLCFC